jgi:hypothetical protein
MYAYAYKKHLIILPTLRLLLLDPWHGQTVTKVLSMLCWQVSGESIENLMHNEGLNQGLG